MENRIKTYITNLAKQIVVKSAVNPSLWACVVVGIPLFFLSSTTDGWRSVSFFIIASILVAVFILSYLYLLFTNPNYLRSENFQLSAMGMRMFGDKDNPFQATANDLVSMANNPALPSPNKKSQKND